MSATQTVYVVDDNPRMLSSLEAFLRAADLSVETCDSARSFLDSYRPGRHGCLVLDIRMPEMSGLELQETLANAGFHLPIIVVSGHAMIGDVVKTMKLGTFDFLEKPFAPETLLERIRAALELDDRRRRESALKASLQARFRRLTKRESEILRRVIAGSQSKEIASEFSLSVSTVDNHRAHIMKKLGARSLAELIRIAMLAEIPAGPSA